MNKLTLIRQRLLISTFISTLMLIAAPAFLIANAYAQEEYNEPIQLSEAQLAQMLAPIALYPDTLLTHILIASTYPLEIVQASRWRAGNSHLDASQAIKKAQNKNWDPSVTALLAFPNILNKLSDDLVWTQQLGAAFLQDEDALLAAIQSLRQQADDAGSLSDMEYMSVSRIDHQIIIEPAQPEIIYVPYYNPVVVYGHWHWYNYPPVHWTAHPYYTPHQHGHFYWSGAVHITFNYYFSTFNWNQRHIFVVNHQNSEHYRHREQIITSHGAQRWQYKPQYRHPRTESHPQVHDKGLRPRSLASKNAQQHTPRSKNSDSKVHDSNQLRRSDKQQISNSESQFNQKRQPVAHQENNAVKIPRQERNEVKMPRQERNEVQMPRQERNEVQMPRQERNEVKMLRQERNEVQMPRQERNEVKMPRQERSEVQMPRQERNEVKIPRQERSEPNRNNSDRPRPARGN